MDLMDLLELGWALALGGALAGAALSQANAWNYDADPEAHWIVAARWRRRALAFTVLTVAIIPLALLLPWKSY